MRRFIAALLATLAMSLAAGRADADIALSINFAPPMLPVYEQPMLPGDGYIWMPGYWAYDRDDYYWVPGTWVRPPRPGLLWTPGYWGWGGSGFSFNTGYWAISVGYYGGVDYGHGYGGHGYEGGRWSRGRFMYNRSVNNIDRRRVSNTYNKTVIHNTTINRVSYNGGKGGITIKPDRRERSAERQARVNATADQTRHERTARAKPEMRRSANKGTPAIAATPRAARFDDKRVVRSHGAPTPPATDRKSTRNSEQPARRQPAAATDTTPVRSDRPAGERNPARTERSSRQRDETTPAPQEAGSPQRPRTGKRQQQRDEDAAADAAAAQQRGERSPPTRQ